MPTDDPFAKPYLDVVERVAELALAAEDRLDNPIPACPDWTVRSLVAHLAGLANAWVAGRLEEYGSDAWAAAEGSRFDGVALPEIIDSLRADAASLAALSHSPMGGTPSMWAFGDAVVHEADLRPALAAGRVPDEAMSMGLKAGIARWRQHLGQAGLGPLLIQTPDGDQWKVGDTDAGEVDTVTAERYDLFRALFGRRSSGQVADWDWSGPVEPYLEAGLPAPFRWAHEAVVD